MLAVSKEAYAASPTKKRAQSQASSMAAYDASPTKRRAQIRVYSKRAKLQPLLEQCAKQLPEDWSTKRCRNANTLLGV